jgi:predicted nucleotidyltransferase component of viral defense system
MAFKSPSALGETMIAKQELLKKQKEFGVPLPTVEKDYILGLILACLYRHPIIKENWVFKGGTCLKKIYFHDYRFSEDLDFTLKQEASIQPRDIEIYLLEAFKIGTDLFGLKIDKDNLSISPFPDKEGLFIQIKVPFQSPLMTSGSLPRVKLDLSKTEILVDPPYTSPLLHLYSDAEHVITPIHSYTMNEIFAEKCRALVERTRPRDLYDVIHLYDKYYASQESISHLRDMFGVKFQHKGLSFPADFLQISENKFQDAKEAWTHMLSHQITPLKEIESYVSRYKEISKWIIKNWES